MPFGMIDTSFIDFPSTLDAAYLRGLTTRSGLQFVDLAQALDRELAALNAATDPLVASLVAPTTREFSRATNGDAFNVTRKGQYTVARPQQTETKAHMLPLDDWDVSVGFTEDGLEDISEEDFNDQVRAMRRGWEVRHRKEALFRLFSDAELEVAANTTALSPGFAGSGSGGNVFTGSYPNGTPVPGGYTHYLRDTAANIGPVLLAARNLLKRMGQPPPYDLVAPSAQIDAIVALGTAGGFVPAGSALVRVGSGQAEAQVDPATYVGVLHQEIRVQVGIEDFTDANIAVFKSFGPFAANNPLAWRYDTLRGRDVTVRTRALYPLADAESRQRFGFGANNRTAAVLVRLAGAGNYVAPVI